MEHEGKKPGQQQRRETARETFDGFRAGKAPLDIVKQHFTGHAKEEALDGLIRKHVPLAIEELKLRVVETPSVEDVKWKDGEPLTLQIRVEVAPTPAVPTVTLSSGRMPPTPMASAWPKIAVWLPMILVGARPTPSPRRSMIPELTFCPELSTIDSGAPIGTKAKSASERI